MNKTILIVDDQTSTSTLFEFILQQTGYKTFLAATGQQALQIIDQKKTIDLVFIELKLTDNSAIPTIKTLYKRKPKLRIMAMTSYNGNNQLKSALEFAVLGILYKPFDIEEVLTIIQSIFQPVSQEL